MPGWLQRIDRRVPVRVSHLIRRFMDRQLVANASSLAFYGLISALPVLMLSFALIEAVAGDGTLQEFADRTAASGPEGSAQFLDQLVEGGGSLTPATVLFTIWPASAYGGALRRALVRSTDEAGSSSGFKGRLMGLGVVFVLPGLLLAGIPLMVVLTTFSSEGRLATVLGWSVALAAATAAGTLITALIYHVVGPTALGWTESFKGAVLTALLSAGFSLAFVLYLNVADTEERFGGGTIAVVVLLGVWLFVTNILLLAGYHTALELEDAALGD